MSISQLSLINDEIVPTPLVVNVASVPQRSPFRYPGGKTWLVPRIRQWLRSLPQKPRQLIEPFAGGGIVSLTVAFEDLASSVTMVELDENVAAVWQTMLNGGAMQLAEQISTFNLSRESAQKVLSQPTRNTAETAFKTILRNRINHGGILAPGSGMVKTGENGKGILSRWYPQTLRKRILCINMMKEKIHFIHGDGLKEIQNKLDCFDTAFFVDPPYTAGGKNAGSRLYAYNQLDHERLFELCSLIKGNFLMTYDNAEDVMRLAQKYKFQTRLIAMKNTHHAKMTELLISRDLTWLE